MSWAEHHAKSEALSSAASAACREGSFVRGKELYREAAKEEMAAVSALDPSKVKTLAITVVSAASLWYKAKEYEEVERVVYYWLAKEVLPAFAVGQLQEILQASWSSVKFRQSGIEFVEGEVLIAVRGGEVAIGAAPLDLVQRKVTEIRNLFYRTIEMLLDKPLRSRGLPDESIQSQFRPWLIQAPAGSYQFAVRVQQPEQLNLFPEIDIETGVITEKFLNILGVASADDYEEVKRVIPRPDYRRVLLKQAKNLAPTGKVFDELSIRAAIDTTSPGIRFSPESRRELSHMIRLDEDLSEGNSKKKRKREKVIGVLVGVHLEKDWIELRRGEGEIVRIRDTGDAIDDVIGPMVNHQVEVDVSVDNEGKTPKYYYVDIESIE